MNIRRNIKVRNVRNVANNNNQDRLLKSNGFGDYDYPKLDKVPAGRYFSKIIDAKYTKTSTGKDAIEVLYDLEEFDTFYQIAVGVLPKDTEPKMCCVKQRYPEDTPYYYSFIDAMSCALEEKVFKLSDILGVTEFVWINYEDNHTIGGISRRAPCTREELVEMCIDLYEERNKLFEECCDNDFVTSEETSEVETVEQLTENESVDESICDEDDDFDDFMDECDWDD